MNFHDFSNESAAGYNLARVINGKHYNNILIFEIHSIVKDPSGIWYWEEGLETFVNRNREYYKIFVNRFLPDDEPAHINVVAKINNEWFVIEDCGANYYNGYGPGGIFAIRKACFDNGVFITYSEMKFSDWLTKHIGSNVKLSKDKKSEFEKIVKGLEFIKVEMQRRRETYFNLKEEELRDVFISILNQTLKGRANAEAKNGKGKTDILIRNKKGNNEYIFELKIWNGIESLKAAISQLLNYTSWHNYQIGLLFFCKNKNYSSIISQVKKHIVEFYTISAFDESNPTEIRFYASDPNDSVKKFEINLSFINLM